MSDIYIILNNYHLLLASSIAKNDDVLIIAGDIGESWFAEKIIESVFSGNARKTPNYVFYKSNPVRLIRFRKNIRRVLNGIEANNYSTVHIYNDTDPIVQALIWQIRSERVLLHEEGIGLYRDTKKRHKRALKWFGKLVFGRRYEEIDRIGESSFVDTIVCMFPEKLNEQQAQKHILKMQKLDYGIIAKEIGVDQLYSPVWFIGQSLVEDGVVSEETYLSGIKELINCKGNKILVKPHPREEVNKYKKLEIGVINNYDIPIEILIDNRQSVECYSYYSSALLNLSVLKNIKAYSMVSFLELSEGHEEITDVFRDSDVILQ